MKDDQVTNKISHILTSHLPQYYITLIPWTTVHFEELIVGHICQEIICLLWKPESPSVPNCKVTPPCDTDITHCACSKSVAVCYSTVFLSHFQIEILLNNADSVTNGFRGASTTWLFALQISDFYSTVQVASGLTFLLCVSLGLRLFLILLLVQCQYCTCNFPSERCMLSYLLLYFLNQTSSDSGWYFFQYSLLYRIYLLCYGIQWPENLIVVLLVNISLFLRNPKV
jgi:hypothetical protein